MKKQKTGPTSLHLGKRAKIDQANSTILIVVIIASVVLSLAVVLGNFLYKQKTYNDFVYKEKRIARDTLKQNVVNAKDLQEQFATIEGSNSLANSQTILDALPGTYDNPELRTSVETLVKRSGLTLTALTSIDEEGKVPEVSVAPQPVEIPYSVTVQGDYAKIRNFVNDLERTIRQMKVTAITISGSDSDMRAELTVTTYFQPTRELKMTTKEVR